MGESRVPVETIGNGYELGQTLRKLASDYDPLIKPIRAIFARIRNHDRARDVRAAARRDVGWKVPSSPFRSD